MDRVCELGERVRQERKKKGAALIAREPLVAGLKAMEPALRKIAAQGETMGLETEVMNHLRAHILARADELAAPA